jgi:predicted phage terminase large subunit-like protein
MLTVSPPVGSNPASQHNLRYLMALKRQQAALFARDRLLRFGQLLRPDPDHADDPGFSLYQAARHHEVIAAALEEVEAGRIKRLIVNCPPRHGKSELTSRLFPAWFIGRHPTSSLILATYNEKFSWDFGREVRQIIEDPIYGQIFPGIELTSASVDRVETTDNGKLFFVGRGGSITGRGAIGLILDDPIKDRVEADSPTTRNKLWTWYTQVIKSRLLTSKGWIVIIQTRWHEDDLVGRLTDPTNVHYNEAEARKWRIIDLPALARENDPIGRKPGQALWPARFPKSYLEEMREGDSRGFQALYQGSPTPEKGHFFDGDRIKLYHKQSDLPAKETLRFYAASDHAVSTRQDADKTCMGVVGIDPDDNIWLMPELVWGRYPTDRIVELMIDMMAKYKPVFWWAEKGHISKSIGPFLRKRMLERQTFAAVYEMTPSTDKQSRAQAIQARISMGKVYMPSFAPWWGEARNELLKFPFGTHDDFVDFLSWIGIGLVLQVPRAPRKSESKAPKVGTLGWLKDESKRQKREEQAVKNGGW